MLDGKKILVGISGGIAAYKVAQLVRLFIKEGAEVKVVMTPAAKEFVTPLTLSTLSKNPVHHAFQANDQGEWNNHVELALWADLIVIAPLTANTLAKMVTGVCDNLLMAVYLSAKCPVVAAPAMDLDMYKHSTTQKNLDSLVGVGVQVIDAREGELASGLEGKGRMAEPEEILEAVLSSIESRTELAGKEVLVTAGPTYEKIDPVRFIGNFSSGKMGIALADELQARGAQVRLIIGPVSGNSVALPNVETIQVTSAEEMFEAARKHFPESNVAVLAAAVVDFAPSQTSDQKIKKGEKEKMQLELEPTPDIAKELGKQKKNGQLLVGFALETENEKQNAASKLESKNFDFIVLNSLRDEGAGFGHDTNKISILDKGNNVKEFELKSKKEVAKDIVDEIAARLI